MSLARHNFVRFNGKTKHPQITQITPIKNELVKLG